MSKKTCKDCRYATKKIDKLFYCDIVKWIMNIASPACVKYASLKNN